MSEISFEKRVLAEILERNADSGKTALAGMAAIVQCTGSIRADSPGGYRLVLQSERQEPLIKFFTLIKKAYNISLESGLKEANPCNNNTAGTQNGYSCEITGALFEKIAASLRLIRPDGSIVLDGGAAASELLTNERCIRSFLAGQFLCLGRVRDPEKAYYLSFDIISGRQAQQTVWLLQKEGLPYRLAERGRSRVVITRDSSVIVDTLNLLGAHSGMMDFENARIRRQFRGKINREVNCETANIQKTVAASAKQLKEIEFLRKSPEWKSLPESLRQIALLREEYPESSLQELGEMLSPPVGKSGVNHRLRRLSAIAAEAAGHHTDGQR